MTSFKEAIAQMNDDEAVIKITDTKQFKSSVEKILIASFDDGTNGIYTLDLKHGVRIWVVWKKKEKQKHE